MARSKYKFQPVRGFMPKTPLDSDARYVELVEGMSEEDVEFAKALVLTGGNKARAVQLIFPTMPYQNVRNRGTQFSRRARVLTLYEYLSGLDPSGGRAKAVSRETLITDIEREYEQSRGDPKMRRELRKELMQLKGYDREGQNADHRLEFRDAVRVLEDFVGGLELAPIPGEFSDPEDSEYRAPVREDIGQRALSAAIAAESGVFGG